MTKEEIQKTVDRDFDKLKSLYKTPEIMFSILWKIEQAKQAVTDTYAQKRKGYEPPKTVGEVYKDVKG